MFKNLAGKKVPDRGDEVYSSMEV